MDGSSRIRVQFCFLFQHARVEDVQVSRNLENLCPSTHLRLQSSITRAQLFSMLLQRVKKAKAKERLRLRLLQNFEETKVSYQLITRKCSRTLWGQGRA